MVLRGAARFRARSRKFVTPSEFAPDQSLDIVVSWFTRRWENQEIMNRGVLLPHSRAHAQDSTPSLNPLTLDGRARQDDCRRDLRDVLGLRQERALP